MGRLVGGNEYMQHALCNRRETEAQMQLWMFVMCYICFAIVSLGVYKTRYTIRRRSGEQKERVGYQQKAQTRRENTKTYTHSVIEPAVELSEWRAPL